MRHYIYGLIDPRDYRVRYVGRTSQRMEERLAQHVNTAERSKRHSSPVYRWIRELLPLRPRLVCLEICDGDAPPPSVSRRCAEYRHPAQAAEIKWIKRFRRDCLNDLETEQRKRDWQKLVNPAEVTGHE